jgi:hypothetical protein
VGSIGVHPSSVLVLEFGRSYVAKPRVGPNGLTRGQACAQCESGSVPSRTPSLAGLCGARRIPPDHRLTSRCPDPTSGVLGRPSIPVAWLSVQSSPRASTAVLAAVHSRDPRMCEPITPPPPPRRQGTGRAFAAGRIAWSATRSRSSLGAFHTVRFVHTNRLRRDVLPEFHGRSLVEQAHGQGRAAPVLDRALPTAGGFRSPLEARIFLVSRQLGPMDGKLLPCQAQARRRWRQARSRELGAARLRPQSCCTPPLERGRPRHVP